MSINDIFIEYKNVQLIYDTKRVIHFPNFKLSSSDRILIYGPNGSGKSSLLYSILQSLPFLSGSIYIKKGIQFSYLPQNIYACPFSTVEGFLYSSFRWENRFFFHSKRIKKHIHQMLDRYGILECKDTFMEELSFGQKKKIHIIRMFLMQKDVYLWDEPDSGLDEATKKWFIQSMQLLGGSHMLVSHEKDLYDTCTDKKILIH